METLQKDQKNKEEKSNQEIIASLPKVIGWNIGTFSQYQGTWYSTSTVEPVMLFQQNFQAHDTDVILSTMPRSGTLWLKAMTFAIVNRSRCSFSQHPLLTIPPHDLVPFFENMVYTAEKTMDLTNLDSPRLFSTHVPYLSLPESIKNTSCKVIYLCRNPRDNFISLWHFFNGQRPKTIGDFPLDEAFEMYCNGESLFGPFWDHVLGYWRASLSHPEKVLFLMYEDLKKDTVPILKGLAKFLGYPFSLEEESKGLIEEILKLCSFDHLRNLDVNKNGLTPLKYERKILFRKAAVGDWVRYLTPSMVELMDKIVQDKLRDSGMIFNYNIE